MTTKKKSVKKGQISSMLPSSPAKDYEQPKIHKVLTRIVVDEEAFIPKHSPDSSCATIFAKIEENTRVALAYRTTMNIDCGFSMELSANYRAVIKPVPELAKKGLMVNENPCVLDKSNAGRVCVNVINVGKEIIVINNGDPVAEMYVEPVYLFDWTIE